VLRAAREIASAADDISEELRGLQLELVECRVDFKTVELHVSSDAAQETVERGIDVDKAAEAAASERGEFGPT
jgi:hypothetical protein